MRTRNIGLTAILMGVAMLCLVSCGQKKAGPHDDSQSALTWQEQYDLGIRYLSECNYDEAILAFTAAIEIEPNLAPAYIGRGDAYILDGETERNLTAARVDYERAIELDEANASAYLGLAGILIKQGEFGSALTILRQGLEKTGGHDEIASKIEEVEELQDGDGQKMVLTLQAAYEAEGTPRSYWKYVYDESGDLTQVEYRHYQKDGSYNEGIAPHENWESNYMLTSGTGEVVPVICLDPLLEDGKREKVQSDSNTLRNIAGTDTYAVYEFDEFDNPVVISSYQSDGTLSGTAELEWSLVRPTS